MENVFRYLLDELESSYPETVKIPSQHGGYIRVAVSKNAEWYSHFCRKHRGRNRRFPKPRTIIRRQHTIKALQRMIQGDRETTYAKRLMDFIRWWYDK